MEMTHQPKPHAQQSVSRETFVNAMGAAATGVNVITTEGVAGRFGITVSALSSVSADPPLLLICVNRKNPSVAAITQNGHFAVNILSEAQSEIAQNFAGRPLSGSPYAFTELNWKAHDNGLPQLVSASAFFACEIESIHDAGTHRIFIGRVTHAERGADAPLVYANRSYAKADLID
jgi:flavin reductase (DIM6/NTAB) family NADH-FMN oxidoreductase RutF